METQGARLEVLTVVLMRIRVSWDVIVSLDEWFLMFQTIVSPSSSRVTLP
jgi:hypothetical protein